MNSMHLFAVGAPRPKGRHVCQLLAKWAAAIAFVIGASNLLVWLVGAYHIPGLLIMRFNASLGVIFSATALGILLLERVTRFQTRLASCLALGAAAIGGLTTLEYISGWNLGIDELFWAQRGDSAAVFVTHPGRMSLNLSISLFFGGMAVALLECRAWRSGPFVSPLLATVAMVPVITGLVGYILQMGAYTGLFGSTKVLLHAALAMACISAGVLLGRPDRTPVRYLISPGSDGLMMRWLAPPALALLCLLGWGIRSLELRRLFSAEDSLALLLLGALALVGGLLVAAAAALARSDSQRSAAIRASIESERLLEATRRTADERLQLAVQAAQVGAWDIDLESGAAIWSPEYFTMLGYAPDRSTLASVETWRTRLHPEDRLRVEECYRSAQESGAPMRLEHRIIRADTGEVSWLNVAGRTISEPGDGSRRFVGVSADITERRMAEEALREVDRKKDEFLAMLSHELRNPVASLTNAVTVLESPEREDDQQWAKDVMKRQTAQLGRLIDDLLDVSRVTHGKVRLRLQAVDCVAVCMHVQHSLAQEMEQRSQRLIPSFPAAPLWVHADPSRLEQIIANLLSNAAKYTPAGGSVWLEARAEGDEAVIVIRDNGVGIPADKIQGMFDLFVQGERSAARSEGGLGIGLTVVKMLCELHGGAVAADSEGVGKGAAFTVRLPLSDSPAEHANGSSPLLQQASEGQNRVLVVDDNADTAAGLQRLLQRRGYEVQLACDGPSALDRAREFQPQAVLLDLGLPGMDGFQVARELRKTEQGATLLIVAVTGYGQAADLARSAEAGFDHHLVKPVRFEELLALLSERLRG